MVGSGVGTGSGGATSDTALEAVLAKHIATQAQYAFGSRTVSGQGLLPFTVVPTPDVSWDDIGGLEDVKTMLKETIVLPQTHPEVCDFTAARPHNACWPAWLLTDDACTHAGVSSIRCAAADWRHAVRRARYAGVGCASRRSTRLTGVGRCPVLRGLAHCSRHRQDTAGQSRG